MSTTAERKIVYVDGDIVEAKHGTVDVSPGGLEGTEEMASQGFAGLSYEPKPGKVEMDIIITPSTDYSLWDTVAVREIYVSFPDTPGKGWTFTGMKQQVVFQSSGATAKLTFCGPTGVPE
jgi:hypothetical protein